MPEYFRFKGKDECGTTRYLDVAAGECSKGAKLIGYHHFHGGSNQQWRWDQDRIVSAISPNFCLVAEHVKDGAPISLHFRDGQVQKKQVYEKYTWSLKDDGVITLKDNDQFYIGLVCDKLILRMVRPNRDPTKWEVGGIQPDVRPAASCHLQYGPIPEDKISDSWTLENSVNVRNSADSTYFCVVGFGPGGYCGIQQINGKHKVAIFSMWHDGLNSVQELQRGNGVTIRCFGGEGNGLKAMKDVNWKADQKVTFQVTGLKVDVGGKIAWRCSCWYSVKGGDWNFMACFERAGNPPFNNHFYSFVEDWDRKENSEGHVHRRCAEFSDAKVLTPDGDTHFMNEAIFTKQTRGNDEFGHEKAFCGMNPSARCFVLSTGGDSGKYISAALAKEGCHKTSTTPLVKLTF